MGIPVSLFLIAIGAILTWAIEDRSRAVDLNVVGVILMLVGLTGIALSLYWWDRWGGGYFRRRTYVDGPPAGYAPRRRYGYGRRTRIVEEEGGPPAPGPGPAAPPPPGPGPYDAPPPP